MTPLTSPVDLGSLFSGDSAGLLEALGLWYLPLTTLLMALAAPLPPVPGEVLVIGAGALAADGRMDPVPAVLASTLGCLLGDALLYALFRYRLTAHLDRWAWGRRIHRGIRRLLERAGEATSLAGLFMARFISGGRTASMSAAGIAGIRWVPFLSVSAAGSLAWSVYMVGLGWLTGETTGLPWWASGLLGVALGTVLGAVLGAVVAWRRRRGAS